jgi:hypothetical protein
MMQANRTSYLSPRTWYRYAGQIVFVMLNEVKHPGPAFGNEILHFAVAAFRITGIPFELSALVLLITAQF